MNLPLYQYSKELKCWVWISSIQATGSVEQHMFPEGCFGYQFWRAALFKTNIDANFMKDVRTISIQLS